MLKILKAMKDGWKAASTEKKVGIIIDILCGAGAGILSTDLERKYCEGHNRLERIFIRTLVFGGTLYAGEKASEALKDNYGEFIGNTIDGVRGRLNEAKAKAEEEDRTNE